MSTSPRRVALTELTVFQGILPLASGYLQTFACTDPAVRDAFAFHKLSRTTDVDYDELLAQLVSLDAEVYGLSCYVWNAGLVRRLVDDLHAALPSAWIVLGGPQVMNQGERYLDPAWPRRILCNGEGERTFRAFLQQLLADVPDLSQVGGLSYHAGGALHTTEPEPRIRELTEIPSPFLEGVFDGHYTWAIVETNRGCPYKCSYCFWGAATGSRVSKMPQDRVEQELEWLASHGCQYVFFADANFGMLQRDVELTRHLAACRERYGNPRTVYFCGAKNQPERVAEITRILHAAGMVTTQSISLQTMSPTALAAVNRGNIRTTTYTELQAALNRDRISSFLEIIWPLPGETLSSFRAGLGQLCALGADSFLIYPLLLMNNVELDRQRDALGLVTRMDPDPRSEADIVVGTNEVDAADYADGVRFSYVVTALWSLRGLRSLATHLHRHHGLAHEALFGAFLEHCRARPDHPFQTYIERSLARFEHYRFDNVGGEMHLVLHEARDVFDELLHGFATTQPWWSDRGARIAFEIDLLDRPYVYSNTPIRAKTVPLREVEVLRVLSDGYLVRVPDATDLDGVRVRGDAATGVFKINHRREQLPFMVHKPLEEHHAYCQDMLHKMGSWLPRWTGVPAQLLERAGLPA